MGTHNYSGSQKAAILLLSFGEEISSEIFKNLNEFEIKGILAANRGASSWKKNGGEILTGIGCDYELEDGSVRAKINGNWIMLFSTRLDAFVVEQQRIAKEKHDREAEIAKREQAQKAPESIIGF